jgi:hypothetical protein
MRKILIQAAACVLLLQGAAMAQAEVPTEAELRDFTKVFIALHKNARPKASAKSAQRPAADIIKEQGWTLERYNSAASAVNSNDELFSRFKALLKDGSCAGATQSPPLPCD